MDETTKTMSDQELHGKICRLLTAYHDLMDASNAITSFEEELDNDSFSLGEIEKLSYCIEELDRSFRSLFPSLEQRERVVEDLTIEECKLWTKLLKG